MKISKYTFLFNSDNKDFYIYSTLSNALIAIDEESYAVIKKASKDKSDILSGSIDAELYETLVLKKFIVENDIDSFLFYKSILEIQRSDRSGMHLTLAPTMDCNFRCHYCFEKFKEPNYMSTEVMDSIIKYLNSLDSKPEIHITWFGGEPLMAIPQIEQFYDKLIAGYKQPTHSNIITTGFHINEEAIRVMKKVGITSIQITLDGLKETHNAIKFTKGCDDAFGRVLNNLDLLFKTSDIHVVFRVNLTKQNENEYLDLFKLLISRYKDYKNFGISPAFVMDRGVSNASPSEMSSCLFTPNEAANYVLDLHHKHNVHSPFLRYPSRFFNECAIRNVMSISFDPEGYAYKCWEVIGNKEYAIGILDNEGRVTDINSIVYNRQLYGADPLEDPTCSACKYLPICNGGCPIQRIQNKFEGGKNCLCTFYKGRMDEFLKIHLSLKKDGLENH